MKPGNPPLQSTRLLDQLRERIRYMHYSLATEKVCLYWGMRLRVKDVDFDRHVIIVCDAKGGGWGNVQSAGRTRLHGALTVHP